MVRHTTDREDLYKTRVGRAIIRSAARQSTASESMLDVRRGGKKVGSSSDVDNSEDTIKEISVADHVQQNPFLRRYARLIDNLVVSSL